MPIDHIRSHTQIAGYKTKQIDSLDNPLAGTDGMGTDHVKPTFWAPSNDPGANGDLGVLEAVISIWTSTPQNAVSFVKYL